MADSQILPRISVPHVETPMQIHTEKQLNMSQPFNHNGLNYQMLIKQGDLNQHSTNSNESFNNKAINQDMASERKLPLPNEIRASFFKVS
jgi:hypothetical protein